MRDDRSEKYAEILRSDFHAFFHRTFLELNPLAKLEPNWHLEVLASLLEDVRKGALRRLIINLPPRHLKSHVASISFPAWLLGHDPSAKVLSVTYAQDLSDKLARDCRALMNTPFYQALFDTRLSTERNAVADFETIAGGGRFSTSVGGVVTGRGADVIIIDDPMKADDAMSDARRKSLADWYDNTLRSRLNSQKDGAIVLVMQRLHANDLVEHVCKSETWRILSFPAIAEEDETYVCNTPYGAKTIWRKKGEVLHPAAQSKETLDKLRRSMTEYNFAAQYQQDPQPASGLIVRRDWLKFYREIERHQTFDQILQSWDTANKASQLSDYSACTTWGIKGDRMFLLNAFRKRMEFPELKKTVRALAQLFRADVVLVEDKSSGIQLIQELRAEGFYDIQAAPYLAGDKVMRLRAQTSKIEGGFVLFPESAPWLDQYLLELTTFPNSRHDDQVDSTVNALAWCGKQGASNANAWIRYEGDKLRTLQPMLPEGDPTRKVRVRVLGRSNTQMENGKVLVEYGKIVEMNEVQAIEAINNGFVRMVDEWGMDSVESSSMVGGVWRPILVPPKFEP